jgi:hypothetical protein
MKNGVLTNKEINPWSYEAVGISKNRQLKDFPGPWQSR